MSLWKFKNFETDIDFTDADFMETLEKAYETMEKESEAAPKTGKVSDVIRAQCRVFDNFFDAIFGTGASKKMFSGKASIELRVDAANSLYEFRAEEQRRYDTAAAKYRPNRQQPRHKGKQQWKKD